MLMAGSKDPAISILNLHSTYLTLGADCPRQMRPPCQASDLLANDNLDTQSQALNPDTKIKVS